MVEVDSQPAIRRNLTLLFSDICGSTALSLSMEAEGRNQLGLDHYLLVHGTARATEGGAAELLQRLAVVYLGPGVKFPPFDNPPPGRVIRIAASRVGGVGPWATAD